MGNDYLLEKDEIVLQYRKNLNKVKKAKQNGQHTITRTTKCSAR